MRISDWSSDVCSSDLGGEGRAKLSDANNCFNLNSLVAETVPGRFSQRSGAMRQFGELMTLLGIEPGEAQAIAGAAADWIDSDSNEGRQIGRASCRERVCQYV